MPHILQNNTLAIHVDLPQEDYAKARFDWTGKISSVSFKGKTVTCAEFANPDQHPFCGKGCLLYTSPSPRDRTRSRMPSSA